MDKVLKSVLESGVITSDEDARVYMDNAEYNEWEAGYGDLTIKYDGGYAEIYATEVVLEDGFTRLDVELGQLIRYYDENMNEVMR